MLEVPSSTNHYKENNIILCGFGHYLLEPQTLLEIILKKLVKEEKEPNLVKREYVGAETSAFAFITLNRARDVTDDDPTRENQVSVPVRVDFDES